MHLSGCAGLYFFIFFISIVSIRISFSVLVSAQLHVRRPAPGSVPAELNPQQQFAKVIPTLILGLWEMCLTYLGSAGLSGLNYHMTDNLLIYYDLIKQK